MHATPGAVDIRTARSRFGCATYPPRTLLPCIEQTLVLAGFYIEELATVRQLLDQVGGQAVRVVPSTPALLHAPLAEALAQPEPAWDRPVPPDWEQGGGWGQQRMAVMAGVR